MSYHQIAADKYHYSTVIDETWLPHLAVYHEDGDSLLHSADVHGCDLCRFVWDELTYAIPRFLSLLGENESYPQHRFWLCTRDSGDGLRVVISDGSEDEGYSPEVYILFEAKFCVDEGILSALRFEICSLNKFLQCCYDRQSSCTIYNRPQDTPVPKIPICLGYYRKMDGRISSKENKATTD